MKLHSEYQCKPESVGVVKKVIDDFNVSESNTCYFDYYKSNI